MTRFLLTLPLPRSDNLHIPSAAPRHLAVGPRQPNLQSRSRRAPPQRLDPLDVRSTTAPAPGDNLRLLHHRVAPALPGREVLRLPRGVVLRRALGRPPRELVLRQALEVVYLGVGREPHELAERVAALGHDERAPLLGRRRRLAQRRREPVVVGLLREPRPPVVLAQVPHRRLQVRNVGLEGVHLARRRHGPFLARLGGAGVVGAGERLAVARNLLPLVAVRLERLELAVALFYVLLERRRALLGRLDLGLEVGDARRLLVRVAHAGLERLNLERRRAEALVALRNRAARLVVLLLDAAELLFGIHGDRLESLEFLRAELPGGRVELKLLRLRQVRTEAGKVRDLLRDDPELGHVGREEIRVGRRTGRQGRLRHRVLHLRMRVWLGPALLMQQLVQVEANLSRQCGEVLCGLFALLKRLLRAVVPSQRERSVLEILESAHGLAGNDLGAAGLPDNVLGLFAEVLCHLVVLARLGNDPLDHAPGGRNGRGGRIQMALHNESAHVHGVGEALQIVRKVNLGEMGHERNGALQLAGALGLLEFIPPEAVDPPVHRPLHRLQLKQSALIVLELLDRAVADGVDEAAAHGRHPGELVNGIAASKHVVLVAGVRLARDAFLEEALEQSGLERQSLEAKERQHGVAVLLVGLGQEELYDFEVLLRFLRLQTAKLQVDRLDLCLGSRDLELHVEVHHGAGLAV
ncbi:hypothetical protein BN1723_003013 [Verticillium longisporum]|uniref:Uncharacterized protein n=1 Tax=Verticillium longisporum TaxID=100787 RepID=A0A0G4LMM0_VERLO|nr:hypothetical protein BN1723_003013 [Verticillium longisporum]